MKSEREIIQEIAEKAQEAGGRVYFVGGCVRDKLLNKEIKDLDIEVHGVSPDTLYHILEEVGEPLSFGDSFGVYALRGYSIDIAMPRKETATGRGHRDFDVFVDPFLGIEGAARRRDFTVNAIMEDVLTGQILDPYHGREDLDKKILRHVDDRSFAEDPLRVLRGAQFASRFEFAIAEETKKLCRSIDLSPLTKERVEGEMKKALVQGIRPSVFFESLREMDQLSVWFPELLDLIGLEQDPLYHPEGDVWIHSMQVLDHSVPYREEVSDPYLFALLCLTHDFGKTVTTSVKNGRIHAYDHENKGVPIVRRFLERLTSNNAVTRYVLNMVPLHMKPNAMAFSKSPVKSTNRLFDEAIAPKDLVYFSMCDRCRIIEGQEFHGDSDFLFERYEIYEETMAQPYVTGQDLIDSGLTPGEDFKDILAYAHKLRLARIEKASALKQTLAYANQLRHKQG